MQPDPANGSGAPAAARRTRADEYFASDLQGQREWYSSKASLYKRRAQACGFCIIAAGVLSSMVQVFHDSHWAPLATVSLGAFVVLVEGWKQIARYDETWVAYRRASERMKRERRLYTNGVGAYRGITDEAEAFSMFVEAIEAIVAEEQQIYWREPATRSGQGGEGVAPGRAETAAS